MIKKSKFYKIIALISVPFSVFNIWSWGNAYMHIYEWFIRTQFPTLPSFTILQIIGFVWAYKFVSAKRNIPYKSKEQKEYEATDDYAASNLGASILIPWFALFVSWLVYITIY